MARQFVYFMQGLSKTYPGNRKVLDNVHLSFYPDAKIGVLGVNGSGKSTLLRIMAGIDKEYTGEAWVAEGARVGYLEQEPHLDADKSVRENVMLGVAKQKAILDRYNELAVNYSEETADEMTRLQDEIEAAGLWDLDSKVDQAMDALRCPPDDAEVTKLSGGERRRLAQEGREEAAHQRTLEREKEWIAASPKARQAKSKARYQRYEDLLKQASEKQTQTAQITIRWPSGSART